LLEIDPHLHVGQWLAKSDMIGLIGPRQKIAVRGYVAEADVGRLETGSTGTFVPDDLNRPAVSVALASVAPSGATAIELPILASVYGGRIAVEQDAQRRLVPMQSYYLVEMLPRSLRGMPGEQVIRGVVRMAGAPESLLWRTWQQFSRVLIRETGF
jgi:putative peptide zinc metalloprotease protein